MTRILRQFSPLLLVTLILAISGYLSVTNTLRLELARAGDNLYKHAKITRTHIKQSVNLSGEAITYLAREESFIRGDVERAKVALRRYLMMYNNFVDQVIWATQDSLLLSIRIQGANYYDYKKSIPFSLQQFPCSSKHTQRMISLEGRLKILDCQPVMVDEKIQSRIVVIFDIVRLFAYHFDKTYLGENGFAWIYDIDTQRPIYSAPGASFNASFPRGAPVLQDLLDEFDGHSSLIARIRSHEDTTSTAMVTGYSVVRLWGKRLALGYAIPENSILSRIKQSNRTTAAVLSLIFCTVLFVFILVLRKERRLAEEQERDRREVRQWINSLDSFIAKIDLHGNVILFNSGIVSLGGIRAEELSGRKFSALPFIPENQRKAIQDVLQRCARGETCRIEIDIQDAQGTSVPTLFTARPIVNAGGEVIGIAAEGKSIAEEVALRNELKIARDAAMESTRLKSEFLANMSHEIRTPLNGILGMASLALDTELSREQREYLEIVKHSGQSLLNVLNDILDFSKIEAGKLDLILGAFDIREKIEATVKTLTTQAHQKGVELLCFFEDNVPAVVVGDVDRLRQIIVNLVGNAIKFTHRGEIVVSCSMAAQALDESDTAANRDEQTPIDRSDEAESGSSTEPATKCTLHFEVRDTGIGIPADKLDLIFESFTQADGGTTRRYGGTGLGLAISSHLVRLMGGRIWAESELDKGSTFHFTVKLGIQNHNQAHVPPAGLEGKTALVLDDNASSRKILHDYLQQWGLQVQTAGSAHEALNYLSDTDKRLKSPDLLIIDNEIAEMDGFKFMSHFRHDPGLLSATILLLSPADSLRKGESTRRLGIGAYLTKPVGPNTLFNAVCAVTANSRNRQQPVDSPAAPASAPPVPEPKEPATASRKILLGKITLSIKNSVCACCAAKDSMSRSQMTAAKR